MLHRTLIIALLAALAAGCESTPSTGVEGTYQLNVSIPVDECTGQASSFSAEVTIERVGDNVTFLFGDAATLTGTIDTESRIMTVEGTILVDNPAGGTFPGFMEVSESRVTEGSIVGLGTIRFEGTFPGVSGICTQHFSFSGQRLNLSPLPLTGS
ncbi:MAG TPA: hypothetical protein VMR66_04225 [Gemmatimonadota bacterium]|nr:hypothetical protein [Gemmatimonadota bacterium]